MKLYYTPGTCSLAPHILACEAGLSLEFVRVDISTHQLDDGTNYYHINRRGQVPLLELDDGSRLAEGVIIAQFLLDQSGRRDLMPEPGTIPRYRVMEWQNYVSAEIHKSYTPLFNPSFGEDVRPLFLQILRKKYQWLGDRLANQPFLTGDTFTAADAYLFTVTRWAEAVGLHLGEIVPVMQYQARIAERDAVQAALRTEGLID